MPISPKEFKQNNSKLMELEIRRIDHELNKQIDERKFSDRVEVIIRDRQLSISEREVIHKTYKDVGWSKVESKTSEEQGERPGLISYKFYF